MYTRKDIYPKVFYSRTFSNIKFTYDIYNKELLVIFEAFKAFKK